MATLKKARAQLVPVLKDGSSHVYWVDSVKAESLVSHGRGRYYDEYLANEDEAKEDPEVFDLTNDDWDLEGEEY